MKIIQSYFISQLDRYYFDNIECSYKKGWAQLDTTQDAHYFGMWINPIKLRVMSYMEGDVVENQFESIDELTQYLTDMNRNGEYVHIDPGLNSEFEQLFITLELDQFFHKIIGEDKNGGW
jgi:hypothetical protein